MANRRKIVLFVVEGITDQTSLALILQKIVSDNTVRFHVVHGDITSDHATKIDNAKKRIGDEIKKFMSQYSLKKSDLKEVVHLIDTDGCFIGRECVVDGKVGELVYSESTIVADPAKKIGDRNEKKSRIVGILYSMSKVLGTIPYSMYYFSSNREHVFHNQNNVADTEKNTLAKEFQDQYIGDEQSFLSFIQSSEFAVVGQYSDTWDFIRKEENSLKRFCNFHLYFD